jgi:hypothetical protein
MQDVTQANIQSILIDTRPNEEGDILGACFYAYIILIDLCDSTMIKQREPFPKWIYTMENFFEAIETQFQLKKIFPTKYLGDAILYVIPDYENENSRKYMTANKLNIPKLNVNEIIELCFNTKNNWWETNKNYIKYKESLDNFKSLTVSMDYGLVFDFNQRNESTLIDPLGTPVDRCFRLSKYAGKNHIVCSSEFIEKLKTNRDNCYENAFIPIKIKSPKGFDSINTLYVLCPSAEEEKWIMSADYEQLIYDTDKPLNQRLQTRILLKEIDRLRGSDYE